MFKNILKRTLLTITLAVLFWSFAGDAIALSLDPDLKPDNLPGVEIQDATDETNPETAATQTLIIYVGGLVSKVLLFASSVAIGFLIFAGGNYIFAFGKDERIERGKRGMVWSIIGLLVILLSYAIVRGIITILSQVDSQATSMYNLINLS